MNSDNYSLYLQATSFIDSNDISIRKLSSKLTESSESSTDSAIRLFEYVRDRIRYNPYSPMLEKEDYKASVILQRGYGFCVQKAILLVALCRNAGIPAKLGFADIRSHRMQKDLLELMGTNLFTHHGFAVIYLNGRWVKATPAFDSEMCRKNGFKIVHFDGNSDAVLSAVDEQGRKHIDYVRDLGCYDDVPLQRILESFYELYVKPNPELLDKVAEIQASPTNTISDK